MEEGSSLTLRSKAGVPRLLPAVTDGVHPDTRCVRKKGRPRRCVDGLPVQMRRAIRGSRG